MNQFSNLIQTKNPKQKTKKYKLKVKSFLIQFLAISCIFGFCVLIFGFPRAGLA